MNTQLKVLVSFLSVISANCLYAGFLDGLKKMGEGVVDVAGGVVDSTVNVTTSAVQSVKQRTIFADPQPEGTDTEQTAPADTPATAPTDAPATAPTDAPATAPADASATAPAPDPAPVTAPTPQVTERKSPSAENGGDNELSRSKPRKENIERERQDMTQKAVESSVRKVIEEELAPRCAEYNKAMDFAEKIYSSIRNDLGPHHPYVDCEKAIWRTTHFGHGHENGPDGIYSLYNLDGWKDDPVEGRKIFQSGQSKLTKEVGDQWIAHVREWLARNDALLSRLVGVGIKEKSSAFYAKAGGTNTVPFNVYRGIAFGSLIGDVYGEMERHAQNSGANSLEWRGGGTDMFLNGCSFNVTVKPHDIQFMFGAFAPDEVPVLTAMTMKFTQAPPSVDAMVEKYGKMDGARVERKSEVVKRVWPENEIGQFWKMVATTLEAKVKQSGGQGVGDALKKEVESIFAAHSKAITREKVRIVIGGVTVDISEDPTTHAVSSALFKDTLLANRLMELCKNQKEAAKKAEAEAKEATEKKAKSDSLDF